MEQMAHVTDIMTENVKTVGPKTTVAEIIKILNDTRFNGLPVVDTDGKLLGLVTEYNLINHQSLLPAFLDKKWEKLAADAQSLATATADQVMEAEPLTLRFSDTYEATLGLFNKHHRVNPVPVVDENDKLVGIVSRYDLLKLLRLYGHT